MTIYKDSFLRKIRNQININIVIKKLSIPNKVSENIFRFLCPLCNEFNTATNDNTNLARCFICSKNFNCIDIVMISYDCSFLDAIKVLKRFFNLKD